MSLYNDPNKQAQEVVFSHKMHPELYSNKQVTEAAVQRCS